MTCYLWCSTRIITPSSRMPVICGAATLFNGHCDHSWCMVVLVSDTVLFYVQYIHNAWTVEIQRRLKSGISGGLWTPWPVWLVRVLVNGILVCSAGSAVLNCIAASRSFSDYKKFCPSRVLIWGCFSCMRKALCYRALWCLTEFEWYLETLQGQSLIHSMGTKGNN